MVIAGLVMLGGGSGPVHDVGVSLAVLGALGALSGAAGLGGEMLLARRRDAARIGPG